MRWDEGIIVRGINQSLHLSGQISGLSGYLSGLVILAQQLVPLDDGLGAFFASHVPFLSHRLDVFTGLAQLLLGLGFVLHLVAVFLQQLALLTDGTVPVHQR